MRIAYDVTPLCVPQSGVGTYTLNLLEHLNALPGDQIVPLAHRSLNGYTNKLGNVLHVSHKGLNKTIWMQAILPWQLARLRVEVCHFLNNVASVWTPCPSVVTIHDMTLWLFPEYHYRRRQFAMRPFIPLATRRADAIVVNSHSTKQDLVRILKVPQEKVRVVYGAPAPAFQRLAPGPDLEAVRLRYNLPEHFILYVGTIEPRKNLVRLLEAFAKMRRSAALPHHLVMVGQRGWKDESVFAAVERLELKDSVHFLGHIPIEALVALYNLADAMAFPSLYEGFGLPVIEAMACGTPVVTSRKGSLAEVAGDAAEFIDPLSPKSIAEGLLHVLTNAAWRAELQQRGLERAAHFTWQAAAQQARQLYGEVYAAHSSRTREPGIDGHAPPRFG
jgi:glycosyltransferase involved in cell wall biosynthesis